MSDVVKFLMADIFKLLAACLEFLVNFNGFFGHLLVSVLRAADERKIWTGSEPFMTIGIQPNPENNRFLFSLFTRTGHGKNVNAILRLVNLAA